MSHVVDFDMYEDVCSARDELAADVARLTAERDTARILFANIARRADIAHLRGDTYRSRALALVNLLRTERDLNSFYREQLTRQHQRALAAIRDRNAAEARAELAEKLLDEIQTNMGLNSSGDYWIVDLPMYDKIVAALAEKGETR